MVKSPDGNPGLSTHLPGNEHGTALCGLLHAVGKCSGFAVVGENAPVDDHLTFSSPIVGLSTIILANT